MPSMILASRRDSAVVRVTFETEGSALEAGEIRTSFARYAWGGQGFGNLVNAAGLPAGPFSMEVK